LAQDANLLRALLGDRSSPAARAAWGVLARDLAERAADPERVLLRVLGGELAAFVGSTLEDLVAFVRGAAGAEPGPCEALATELRAVIVPLGDRPARRVVLLRELSAALDAVPDAARVPVIAH
jgi:hypothetical protein